MATDDSNDTNQSSVNVDEEDAKFGFTRPEMYSLDISYTVDLYQRHVFLCYKGPDSWAPRVEESETDPLPKRLTAAIKARKDDIDIKTKLTTCGGSEGSLFADGDVLVFPDMVKYRGLKDSNLDSFVDDVLVNCKPWASAEQEVLTGSHVFVCAHGSRDKRCGVCGPALMEKLSEEIASRGLNDRVFVSPCSHIGGHKYAGNLIIYGPHKDGKIAGHWYGYVTPEDVPEILDQHIVKGEIVGRLWRGEMGTYEKRGREKLPNGKDDESSPVSEETVTSCCQGANGVSCCQEVRDRSEGKKGMGRVSCWIGKWEQSDVLMAVGVVGAVATVAVAYSFYRRSG